MAADFIHALNRGVDKRDIFMDDHDRFRFVYGLMIFNDTKPVDIAALKSKGLTMSFLGEEAAARSPIVDIHAWCLMKNHYHLLLSERIERGVSLFLKKLNIGYAKYFNDRYKRSGTLYQGRTKQVPIRTDAHFLHMLHYIHLNPLDFSDHTREWRERKIVNSVEALSRLDAYRWSSYANYCGQDGFSSIITREVFGDVFKDYKEEVRSYLQDIDISTIKTLSLE